MDGVIGVSDYGVFDNGKKTIDVLKNNVEETKSKLETHENNIISEDVFQGPIAENCKDAFASSKKSLENCVDILQTVSKYLSDIYTNYQKGDYEAVKKLLGVTETTETTEQQTDANSNSGNANQDYIYNYLAEQGFNKAAICGILANIEYESGFKTGCIGDSGTSYGICQWHNSRWNRLKNYCKENGLDASTVEGQSKFLVYELKNYYPSVYNTIKNVPNTKDGAYQAASAWTIHYEVPANKQNQAKKRGNIAMSKYWASYNQT